MFAGKKSAQIREILISESAWEEMTCLFAPSLAYGYPIILGYHDTAFVNEKNNPNFAYYLNTKDGISQIMIDGLQDFIIRNKDVIVTSNDVAYIDTKVLEARRISFFKRVIN
ncbi:Uncharacterised protein [Escherichia coli]|nr:Uncharacterised protein [Escherichia coli]SQZ01666.1 Uncharacterised protein [Escherichia coli]